jgi:predicted nucleic acid-binding protein
MNPKYLPLTEELVSWLAKPSNTAVTSTLSLTELLVPGYREGNQLRVDAFYALATTYPNLNWCPVTMKVADVAAQFRAIHGLKTPEAMQAATAVENGASALLTNDMAYRRLNQLEVAILDDLL